MTQIASHNSAAITRQLSGEKDVMKAVAPVLGLFAAILALATPATALATPSPSPTLMSVRADLNGDGALDLVTVRQAPGDPSTQIVTGTVGGRRYDAFVPLDSAIGVRPLRVGDVDGNGRADIFVTEVVGANTEWLSVWELGQRWLPVRHPDGQQVQLFDGGGIASIVRYGCEVVDGRRELFTVAAELDWDTGIYSGEKVNYVVDDTEATEVSRESITGPREAFPGGHEMCA
jgi:VCBS repeat protein